MASADGGVKYTVAHAFTPKTPKARTSAPTRTRAAITKPLAPPGKVLIFPSERELENFQMRMANMICAARNDTPASLMRSHIGSSIHRPGVETSPGATHVSRPTGPAAAL